MPEKNTTDDAKTIETRQEAAAGVGRQPAHFATRLLTVREWTSEHAWPPEGGLRHLIFNADTNGAHAWIRRVGRRVLIDEAAFFAWVEASKQGGQR